MKPHDPTDHPVVVLVRPENPENIGLAARAMKNMGFFELRIVGLRRLSPVAGKTAVHAEDILAAARLFGTLEEATADLHFVAASTAKRRKIGSWVKLNEAVARIGRLRRGTRTGLLFGNERTGLTSAELRRANLIFTIPQAERQPSYNLGAAVLLTLYAIFGEAAEAAADRRDETPLLRGEQDEVIDRIMAKLSARGFIHRTNKEHVGTWVHDFFGRTAMTDRDRRFLLALFDKGVSGRPPDRPGADFSNRKET
ncbi:MAG: RNA methyltransferase [Candidatus Aminicenantes bacterium]|nr:RNA methyltransferase [Candidatus Aminicenantes bacterium]